MAALFRRIRRLEAKTILKDFSGQIKSPDVLEEKAQGRKSSAIKHCDDFGDAGLGHADDPDGSKSGSPDNGRSECSAAHGRVPKPSGLPSIDELGSAPHLRSI
ncbi:hypothetical protein [Pararhizobium sp. DWP3-4]|uniref:hypothetical protein n=1 Tax=Pararhizobium sp. DWP3-4 TaxID=2804565 RepID=UPI003CEF7CF3